MLSFGNISIKDMYYGSIKIGSAYLGSTKVYSSTVYPYLTFEFSQPTFIPTTSLLNSNYSTICEWKQVSSSPNVWNLEIHDWYYDEQQNQSGVRILFCKADSGSGAGNLVGSKLGGGTCKLIGSGNFNVTLNNKVCQSLDRMFLQCTGLTSIVPIQCSNVVNVGGMLDNCVNVESGALDQYNWFNTYGVNITNHSGTFTSCGENTQTGLAELNQIPAGWGGNMIPVASALSTTRVAYTGTNYSAWRITGNSPDWTSTNGMYLFSVGSVSRYAGVSMNRGRIPNPLNGLGTTQASYALYFYPAFLQCTKIPVQTGNSVSWIVTTDSPNGHLDVGQANTDMSGTLDFSTYGPFTREYGNYDSAQDVYFVFLVTNVPIAQWGGLTDAMGFLYNTGFNADAKLRYFF